MKDFFRLLKRFVFPYKTKLLWNFLFNVLSAVFGIFSFLLLRPSLQILFNTKQLVLEKPNVQFSIPEVIYSVSEYFNYLISQTIIHYGQEKTLIIIGLFIIVTVFLKLTFYFLASFIIIFIRNGVVRDIRALIYRKILFLPLGYFSDERKGDIMARMTNDVSEVENSVMNSLDMILKDPITILLTVAFMVFMSWQLTLFIFVMFPIVSYLIGLVGKSLKKVSRKGQDKMGEILSVIEEDITGLRIIKSFNAENKAITRFNRENENYFHIMNRLMWRRILAHPISEFLGTIIIIIVLWYGGQLILNQKTTMDAAGFIAYLVLFYSIINPAKSLTTAFYSIEKGLASMDRIDKILLTESTIKDSENAKPITEFVSEITYRNVSFAYSQQPVLENINLNIPKGKTIAFVGQSGSGKTTLVDLLPRFWDVSSGQILIDGTDIREIKLKNLRSLIGNVNQEAILFNDTIFNNIAFGVEYASFEEVVNAAKIANAHDFILETEKGYETNIGDRGDKLSGGQKQRIAIARAVLNNPPILILDEATSALDTESEKLVQDALANLMKNRTSLVIAHRLSTVKNADLICVLHKGRIVEQGTHNELIELGGRYRKLHKLQVF